MTNAITALVPVAIRILASVWGNSRNQASLTAMKWLYSEEGGTAFLTLASRCLHQTYNKMAFDIFALQCEIAARKAGWCPELESPAGAGDVSSTDYQ